MKKLISLLVAVMTVAALGVSTLFSEDQKKTTDDKPSAEGTGKTTSSRVVKVTVYPNSAMVTREVDVPKGEGLVELVVPDLPPRTVHSSLYSEGSDGMRVLTTRYRTHPVKQDTREDVRKIEEEMKKVQLAAEKLDGDIKILEQNLQTVTKLENFTDKSAVHSTEKGGLNPDTVIKLASYVMEKRAEKTKELVALKQQVHAQKEHFEFLQRKMRDLTAGTSKIQRDAVIVVDRPGAGGGKIRLNYLVDAASWQPQYKLRAGKAGDAVQMDYLAALVQQTGEDWNNVELTLSTAQPMLNAAPPDLKKLEVSVLNRSGAPVQTTSAPVLQNVPVLNAQPMVPRIPPTPGSFPTSQTQVPAPSYPSQAYVSPEPIGPIASEKPAEELTKEASVLRKKAVEYYNKKDSASWGKYFNEAAAYEQTRDLMKSREDLQAEKTKPAHCHDEGPSVTYHLKTRISIPSRKDEQVLEVAKINLTPKFYYKAVPVLNQHVYRLADLTNKSTNVLLPGEATMYQGSDFVGRMTLPLVAIGEEFTVGFGVDPQLQVQRRLMDKSKETKGGNQVLKYEYRILVNSYKTEAVKLQVWDRLPHAESETAGIQLVKAAPEVSKDPMYVRENKPHNLLRWDLDIEPGTTNEKAQTINYEFRIELDRQLVIGGFTTR